MSYAEPLHKDSQETEEATPMAKEQRAAIPCPSPANFQLLTTDQAHLQTSGIEILPLDSFLFSRVRNL